MVGIRGMDATLIADYEATSDGGVNISKLKRCSVMEDMMCVWQNLKT